MKLEEEPRMPEAMASCIHERGTFLPLRAKKSRVLPSFGVVLGSFVRLSRSFLSLFRRSLRERGSFVRKCGSLSSLSTNNPRGSRSYLSLSTNNRRGRLSFHLGEGEVALLAVIRLRLDRANRTYWAFLCRQDYKDCRISHDNVNVGHLKLNLVALLSSHRSSA